MSVIEFYSLLAAAASVVFGAGGAYFTLQQGRRDMNGIGRKVNTLQSEAQSRYQRMTIALMLVCTTEQKQQIAELLQEKPKEGV